jgi:tetratricopeptide (TPR) repeat protein
MILKVKAVRWMRAPALVTLLLALCGLVPLWSSSDPHAQQENTSPSVEIGIILVPTLAQAQNVVVKLKSGTDFGVLAKETSSDPTAKDGGYMGRLSPAELPPEFRDALGAIKTGEITNPIRTENGFAILTILPKAPNLQDLDLKKLQVLVSSGAVHRGPDISGFGEADKVLLQSPKPEGWDRDLSEICELRKQSGPNAIEALKNHLAAIDAGQAPKNPIDIMRSRIGLAQLYAFAGQMQESIDQLKQAYALAQAELPQNASIPLRVIGAAYLHLSEMENGFYLHQGDKGIFPPLPSVPPIEKQENARTAIQYLSEAIQAAPDDYQMRWLLNYAYAMLGEYPDKVPPSLLIPPSVFQSPESVGRFKDIAPLVGIDYFQMAGGVLVDDFENNGLLDVVLSTMDVCEPMRYYHNNGDGTFTDRTAQAGLTNQLGGLNMTAADYNNDGCLDILVLRGGWEFPMRKSLLRNNCDGTFTDVTDQSGLGDTVTATNSAAWADIDNDGYLDLFIANERSPSQLFRNRGDGTFEDISHSAGIDRIQFSKGVTAGDYDNDGYVDFYVSNLDGANFLYHNNHDLTFTEIARQAGVQAPGVGFATWFFDYDNDGWPDLYVGAYPSVSPDEVIRSYMHLPTQIQTPKLYKNMRNGTFKDVTAEVNLDKVFIPMGSNFGDVDNDGFLDIYMGGGTPSYASIVPHVLLRNDGGKSFSDITQSSGTGDVHKGHAITFADLFRNGHEDIIANFGGAVEGDRHSIRIFHNPGNDNDWVNIKLVGVKSNRAAFGARINVTVQNDGGETRTIVRTVGYGSSFGDNPLEQHIGLGHGARMLSVDIWWPASDTHQHFTSVGKNQFLLVKEFATDYTRLDRKPIPVPGDRSVAEPK